MGFSSVYQTLKELFPQVDARLLKAVAIEHSKDPDVAVEAVLTEILPFIGDKYSRPTSTVTINGKMVETSSEFSSVPGLTVGENANASSLLNGDHNFDDDSLASSFYDAKDTDDQLGGNTKNEELIAFERCEETNIEAGQGEKFSATSVSLIGECRDNCDHSAAYHEGAPFVPSHEYEDRGADLHVNNTSDVSSSCRSGADGEADNGGNVQECSSSLPSRDLNLAPSFEYLKEQLSVDCNSLEYRGSTDKAFEEHMTGALDWKAHPQAESGMPFSDANSQAMNSYVDADSVHEVLATDAIGAEAETTLSTIVTRSGQICRINLVEDIIEEAKSYKDTMLSAVELVLRLMEEVELQEKEAEQAKAASARGGLDILEKVEEIKKMLKHAKEANDMHAGEVYGEKSILATEVRELQTRLFSLSDEKEKTISILDKMRKSLEERLAVAEEQRRASELEMLEKQKIARDALSEQELIMDKVVQEARLLQQEADENAKLRDFLVEKGRVVDALQGEISVICQDVESLKENFDNRVSLSKSLSIEQTSCRLASSNSSVTSMASLKSMGSVKSTGSVPAIEQMGFAESPTRMSRATSLGCQTPKSSVGEEAIRFEAPKPLLDEDWEIFDMN